MKPPEPQSEPVEQAETHPFELTARKGDKDAQFNLAFLYADGKVVARDYERARYWHGQAARQGHTTAQYSLALMHQKGLGVPKNNSKSARWYRVAAQQGHQAAQFNLAVLYEQGLGVPRDPVMAYVWFAVAAKKSDKPRRVPNKSSDGIALRLSRSTKGGQAASGHCDRIALKLTAHERQVAGALATEYCTRYASPFR